MAEIGELGLNNEGKKSPAISPLSAKTQPLFLSFSEAGGYYFLFLGAKYGHFSFYWPYRPVKKINPQKIAPTTFYWPHIFPFRLSFVLRGEMKGKSGR